MVEKIEGIIQKENVDFFLYSDLKNGKNKVVMEKTLDFFLQMNPVDYGSFGERFVLGRNKIFELNDKRFDCYVVVYKEHCHVIGTGSIKPDDQDVGKMYGISGVWLAALNVRKEWRGMGVGNIIMDVLECHVKNIAISENSTIQANLFTVNPLVRKMCEKRNYTEVGPFFVPNFSKTFIVYSKQICSK